LRPQKAVPRAETSFKFQTPKSKHQRSAKTQAAIQRALVSLAVWMFGISLVLGVWSLPKEPAPLDAFPVSIFSISGAQNSLDKRPVSIQHSPRRDTLRHIGCILTVRRRYVFPVNGILKTLFGGNSPELHNRATGGAYTVDDRDSVQPLAGFPQSSIGAPTPIVIASEETLFVAFYLEQRDPNWDGTTCKVITPDTNDEPVAVVRFSGATAHFFGPPNDEAFSGHPLAARGLHAYGAFEVLSSSWIRALERMNSVHPRHRP
jgi:hypothetical protein